jgi:hypothetical protein
VWLLVVPGGCLNWFCHEQNWIVFPLPANEIRVVVGDSDAVGAGLSAGEFRCTDLSQTSVLPTDGGPAVHLGLIRLAQATRPGRTGNPQVCIMTRYR